MKILGIETSCDETAAAVVENGTQILSDVTASSAKLHQKYGGIVPEVAARQQVRCIIPVIKEALNPKGSGVDAIAVTIGPGLIGSLLVGTETAKALSYVWQKPLVPVNHMVGHIYSAWLSKSQKVPNLPALAITISGGHTELVLMKSHGQFKCLGSTRDDAAGEAFDKVARALGLPYPGGPQIEKLAQGGDSTAFDLPRPMLDQDNLDFSFSGLKTAVLRTLQKNTSANLPISDFRPLASDIAASFQQAIIDVVVGKTIKAAQSHSIKSIFLTGGVSANKRLREQLQRAVKESLDNQVKFFCPPINLAMDNATHIATAAFFNFDKWKLNPKNSKGLEKIFRLSPDPSLTI